MSGGNANISGNLYSDIIITGGVNTVTLNKVTGSVYFYEGGPNTVLVNGMQTRVNVTGDTPYIVTYGTSYITGTTIAVTGGPNHFFDSILTIKGGTNVVTGGQVFISGAATNTITANQVDITGGENFYLERQLFVTQL